jgi:outer membrane protein TolC
MKKIITLFLLLCRLFVGAQTSDEQLKMLVNTALKENDQVKELEQSVRINQTRQAINKSYYQPVIGVNASYSYIDPLSTINTPDGKGGTNKLLFQPSNNFNAALGLNYQLFDFKKIQSNVEKTKIEINTANSNVEFYKGQLAAQVGNIYYSIIYLNDAIDIQDTILNTLDRNLSLVKNKLLHGDALNIDVLNLKSTIASEEIRKVDLKNQLDRQIALLDYAVAGKAAMTKQRPSFDFKFPLAMDTASLMQEAEKANPDLLLAKNKIDLTTADLQITKSNYFPSLAFIANAGYRNGYQPEIYDTRFNYLVGLNFNYYLFQGGRYNKQKVVIDESIKQQQLTYTRLKNSYRRDIEITLNDFKSNQQRMLSLNEEVSTAEEAVKITESRYKNGTSTQVELFNALSNLQRVKLNALNIQYQLCLNAIELSRMSGVKWW